MASNSKRVLGRQLRLTPTDGGVNSGDPCLVGQIAGVAVYNQAADLSCVIDTRGVYTLAVKGVGVAAANIAVAVGDIIYYVPGTTPKLSKSSDGVNAVRFGYALGTVASGATGVIDVRLGF